MNLILFAHDKTNKQPPAPEIRTINFHSIIGPYESTIRQYPNPAQSSPNLWLP